MAKNITIFTACILAFATMSIIQNGAVRADVVNPFYAVGNFNTVIFGDLTCNSSSDNEGYMAVGGNITTTSWGGYGFASKMGGSAQEGDVGLVVGGDLNIGSGQLYAGDYYIGGTNTAGQKFNTQIGTGLAECPVDFGAMQSELRSVSAALVELGTAADPVNFYGSTQITVTSGELNILNINVSDLANGSLAGLTLVGMTSDTQVILNLIGDADNNVLNMLYRESSGYGLWGDNVMLNLVGIDEFNINSHGGLAFSILAVDTDLNVSNAHLQGLVVADNVTMTNAEFHTDVSFVPEVDLPTDNPAATPEPGTVLVFGLGLLGLPLFRRMRRKTCCEDIVEE